MRQPDRIEAVIGSVLRRQHGRIVAVALAAGVAELRIRHALDPEHSQRLTGDELLDVVRACFELGYSEAPLLAAVVIDRIGGAPADPRPCNGRIDDELLPAIRRTAEVLEEHGGDVRVMTAKGRIDAAVNLRAALPLMQHALAELEG